jgi:hypothetical protein
MFLVGVCLGVFFAELCLDVTAEVGLELKMAFYEFWNCGLLFLPLLLENNYLYVSLCILL